MALERLVRIMRGLEGQVLSAAGRHGGFPQRCSDFHVKKKAQENRLGLGLGGRNAGVEIKEGRSRHQMLVAWIPVLAMGMRRVNRSGIFWEVEASELADGLDPSA